MIKHSEILILYFLIKRLPKISKMQKRVLPSTEVSLASKAFEKFFAAQEFEDIIEHYKDFTSILQINAGPLAQFYPVLKVSPDTLFIRLLSYQTESIKFLMVVYFTKNISIFSRITSVQPVPSIFFKYWTRKFHMIRIIVRTHVQIWG